MKTDFLIIGGGVAGLSAANSLADAGADVTLLDAGVYPSHKVCGEFISPEAIPLLARWGITPACMIDRIKFVTEKKRWAMELPTKAATLQRYILDEALARRAQKEGANILTRTQVERIDLPTSEGQGYTVILANGEQWHTRTLLVSTGRLYNAPSPGKRPPFCYVGAKAHFDGIDGDGELVMHLSAGAYFGVGPIAANKVNVAGIIACTDQEASAPQKTLSTFLGRPDNIALADTLAKGTCAFEEWMASPVPEFGVRNPPLWPNAYFLGDAAGVIPPATGNGLAMGITSGILAADYALKNQPQEYRSYWDKAYKRRILRGMLLHRLFLSSRLTNLVPTINYLFPALSQYVFRITRG